MKTHTIKWNGTKTHRIITFTPQYVEILKNSHRDAVSLIITKMLKDLKNLTGIEHTIDYDVMLTLENHFNKKVTEHSISANLLKMWLEQGYINSTLGRCREDIEHLNLFYNTFFNRKDII